MYCTIFEDKIDMMSSEEFGQKCKIVTFPHSHFVKCDERKFLVRKDEPVYELNELICINYNNNEIYRAKVGREFSDFLWADRSQLWNQIDLKGKEKIENSNENSLVKRSPSKLGESPKHNYKNIVLFPALKEFLDKDHKQHSRVNKYKHKDCSYTLSVWHSQAYVISFYYYGAEIIKEIHIDESYALQEGDEHTFVWYVGNGYFVYNSGNVFSTVAIMW